MTTKKLNEQIAELTEKLRNEKPEVYKMLTENPVTIPHESHPDLSDKALIDYIETLKAFLVKPN